MGGQAIRKIDVQAVYVRTLVHVCASALTSLLPSLQPPHSDSPVTEGLTTSHALPHQLPCSSRLAFSVTSPCTHSLSFVFCLPLNSIFSSIHLSVDYLSFISPNSFFLFSSLTPSFGVWVFPVFLRALCAHHAACLCLYGNPEWTRVAQRSVRQTDTDPIRSHVLFLSKPHACNLAHTSASLHGV